MTGRAEEYRRLAQERLKTAPTISNQEGRAALVQMAQIWLRLAEEQEATATIAGQVVDGMTISKNE